MGNRDWKDSGSRWTCTACGYIVFQSPNDHLLRAAHICGADFTNVTDVQLREECVRRGWRSALVDMTDGQLRSECARRKFNQCGPGDMTLLCVLSRHVPEDFPSSELPSWLEGTLLAARVTDAEMAKRLPRNVLAQELRDDELNVECEKRKLISGSLAVVDLVRASDAALRSEVDRRWGECDCPTAKAVSLETARERDDWKRRAELAEARTALHESLKHSAQRSRKEMHEEFLRLVEVLTPEQARRLLPPEQVRAVIDGESGPGIADQRPDNSIAHLPEDLLCDDAD